MKRLIDFASGSIKGYHKKVNKDRVFSWFENYNWISYFAILDGVSSSRDALPAINIANKKIKREIINQYKNKLYRPQDIIHRANYALVKSKYEHPYSTIALLSIPQDINIPCMACTLGDTRIYRITEQYVTQLTKDHSAANGSNIITKCLGIPDIVPDCLSIEEFPNSIFLLCSDGFYNSIESETQKIVSYCSGRNVKSAKKHIDKLVEGKNADDASYLLIRMFYV